MNKLVSVIIPVFNVEDYLKQCIESILKQTYKNLEIIILNDGSTDNSKSICEIYKKKDSRIKLYSKKNGGLSSARNYGLEKSNGDYILFVDSDDFIENWMVEELINKCEQNDCQIGMIGVYKFFSSQKFYKESNFNQFGKVNSLIALKNCLLNGFYAWNKIYKRELIINKRFKDKLYEDIYLIPYILEDTKNIYISEKYGYYYRQRKSSIVHSSFNNKKMDFYYAANILYTHFEKRQELKQELDAFYCLVLSNLISDVYSQKRKFSKEYNLFYNELNCRKKDFINNNLISKKKRIMLLFHLSHLTPVVNIIKKIGR